MSFQAAKIVHFLFCFMTYGMKVSISFLCRELTCKTC